MTCQSKRRRVPGVSVMRTEALDHGAREFEHHLGVGRDAR